MNAFFYSNSNKKSIEKLIFSAFGKILVLANAFFYSNSNLKSIEKLFFFLAFGKILVLANAFFYSNSNSKSIENCSFFSFWQDLGFGECSCLSKCCSDGLELGMPASFPKISHIKLRMPC